VVQAHSRRLRRQAGDPGFIGKDSPRLPDQNACAAILVRSALRFQPSLPTRNSGVGRVKESRKVGITADNVEELISMAREVFVDLTAPEENFLRANAEGRVPNFCVGPEKDNDPANADQWGPERTIRADCIRWLCVTAKARPLIIGNRLRAMGAKIEGALQLDYSTIDFVVAFRCCSFTGKISFEGTSLLSLDFLVRACEIDLRRPNESFGIGSLLERFCCCRNGQLGFGKDFRKSNM